MATRDLITDISALVSEKQNGETMDIDLLSSLDIVKKINREDQGVALAVEKVLPRVATAVDTIVAALKRGGRLVYVGAGTSGRLGTLDAVECPPTYGVPEEMVVALMAGGRSAMYRAKEGAEDDPRLAVDDLRGIDLQSRDVVVGIAASGRTPYVLGALHYATDIGAATVALSCNPDSPLAQLAGIAITPLVGPEVLAGSTRMKAGTAQKMVLNMLTTASMIRLGKSYRNLMIDLKATNKKLLARACQMVMQVTGVGYEQAQQALVVSQYRVKLAIMVLLTDLPVTEAEALLVAKEGFLRSAIAACQSSRELP